MMLSHNKKIALEGLLISCGILFGYIEFLFPLPIGIPGIKLGLSNVITLLCLNMMGPFETLCVLLLRVILSGLLFGNLFGLLYGISGALLSYIVMILLKKTGKFTIIGISAMGGVFHNIAQLLVAALVISEMKLTFYMPIIIVSGLVCGILTGIVSKLILIRIRNMKET